MVAVCSPRSRHGCSIGASGRSSSASGAAVPFLAYSPEIRAVIYSTNAIESLHARFRRSVQARGRLPNEQAALKCLYLSIRSLDPTGRGRSRWKAALNASL